MLLTKVVIASLFSVFYIIDMARLPERLKVNFKPFNCNVCLSFWICVISIQFDLIQHTQAFALAGYAAYFSMILKRIMYKI